MGDFTAVARVRDGHVDRLNRLLTSDLQLTPAPATGGLLELRR